MKINDIVYHFKAAGTPSKYVADTVPTGWTKVTFSDDFTWAVGNAGIYKYNSADSANLKYDVSLATNFNDNKKIYGGSNGIVVMDWIVSATTNVNNYTIKAYKYSTTFIATLVDTISGQYHTTDATKPPIVSIDDSQRTIVVYGKTPADATKFFAQGASIDFSANTVKEFTIPTWITAT